MYRTSILSRTVLQVFKNPLAFKNCKFSVMCVNRNEETRIYKRHQQKSIIVGYNNIQKRNFSLEGLIQWQEQTYKSISNSTLVNFFQDGLLSFHEVSGLSWWSTIIISTVLVRTLVTVPLTVYQNYILAKVENISLEFKELNEELKRETAMARKAYNLTDKQAFTLYKRSLRKQWTKLIVRDNCHPFKASLVVWFQIPLWVCMSFALRNLVYMQPLGDTSALITFTEMTVGGFGWIPNLTEPDQSLILPVAFGLTNLAVIEVQRMSKLRQPSKMYNRLTNAFRVFSIVMIPIAASVPSCMCLYWLTSSSVGLVQNLVLLSPKVRRTLGIPEAPSELQDPYNHMKSQINETIQALSLRKQKN